MARLGIPEEHAEAILNHKKQGIVKVYNLHQYANEKKAAMLLWEAELLRILEAGSSFFTSSAGRCGKHLAPFAIRE